MVAWWRSFGVPVTVVNMQNVYGPLQGAEKFIPKVISAVRDGLVVTVHGSTGNAGSRYWLHVSSVAEAFVHILTTLLPVPPQLADRPARWNIASPDEASNLEVAQRIAALMRRVLYWEWSDSRVGRDAHYGLDGSRLAAAGWKPSLSFDEGLAQTVAWTVDHPEWLAY